MHILDLCEDVIRFILGFRPSRHYVAVCRCFRQLTDFSYSAAFLEFCDECAICPTRRMIENWTKINHMKRPG